MRTKGTGVAQASVGQRGNRHVLLCLAATCCGLLLGAPTRGADIGDAAFERRLGVKLEHLSFQETPLPEVVQVLTAKSCEADSRKTGIRFKLVGYDDGATPPTVTLQFTHISLGEAVEYVCKAAQACYRYDRDEGLILIGPSLRDVGLETRSYAPKAGSLGDIAKMPEDALWRLLDQFGVARPEGSQARYDLRRGLLVITTSTETHHKIERVFEGMGMLAASQRTAPASKPAPAATRLRPPPVPAVLRPLRSIRLPSIEFADVTLQEAVAQLSDASSRHDESRKGVSFVLHESALARAGADVRIRGHARNVLLIHALQEVCRQAGVFYQASDSAVILVGEEPLETRAFTLPVRGPVGDALRRDARAALAAAGIVLQEGETVRVQLALGQFWVHGRVSVLDQLAEALAAGLPERQPPAAP
jgi:hypothetical protein